MSGTGSNGNVYEGTGLQNARFDDDGLNHLIQRLRFVKSATGALSKVVRVDEGAGDFRDIARKVGEGFSDEARWRRGADRAPNRAIITLIGILRQLRRFSVLIPDSPGIYRLTTSGNDSLTPFTSTETK